MRLHLSPPDLRENVMFVADRAAESDERFGLVVASEHAERAAQGRRVDRECRAQTSCLEHVAEATRVNDCVLMASGDRRDDRERVVGASSPVRSRRRSAASRATRSASSKSETRFALARRTTVRRVDVPTDEGEVCLEEPPVDLCVREGAALQVTMRPEPTDDRFRQTQASGHSLGVGVAHDLPVTPR
jgi:hypothetical protein